MKFVVYPKNGMKNFSFHFVTRVGDLEPYNRDFGLRRSCDRVMFSGLVCVFCVFAAVTAKTTWNALENYDFATYVKEFGYKWDTGSPEYLKREIIFMEELSRVKAHNKNKKSWKEGVNFMSSMTIEEKKAYLGLHTNVGHHHQPKNLKSFDLPIMPLQELPEQIDWREKDVITPVKDQGQCGSCWAFASTATIESHVALNSGLLFDLSPQQIASCAPNPEQCGGTGGCYGATAENCI